MYPWQIALAVALLSLALLVSVFVLYCLCCNLRNDASLDKPRQQIRRFPGAPNKPVRDPLDSALRHNSRVSSAWRTTYPIRPFAWSEQPALIAEAVEHGWAAFAFTYTCSTCPRHANLWDMCRGCSHRQDYEPEISWEMGEGSDYVQKICLNPCLPLRKDNATSHVQALQTTLPLPGPPLGANSFPQEGYFEITVVAEGREFNADGSHGSFTDSEHVKLITKHFLSGKNLVSELTNSYPNQMFEKAAEQSDHKRFERNGVTPEQVIEINRFCRKQVASTKDRLSTDLFQAMAIGLAAGGTPPFRLPGCDPSSVGFRSNGEVYLNGVLLVEKEPKVPVLKRSWGVVNTTVGCGFDPAARKVFFTVNGECVYELTASSTEFGNPLYPVIAANYDVTVKANFGQAPFGFAPAEAHRVTDPSVRRRYPRSTKAGSMNDDSGDLFSMGRIDSHWLSGVESPCSEDLQHRHVLSEAESDLFEIVLEPRT